MTEKETNMKSEKDEANRTVIMTILSQNRKFTGKSTDSIVINERLFFVRYKLV